MGDRRPDDVAVDESRDGFPGMLAGEAGQLRDNPRLDFEHPLAAWNRGAAPESVKAPPVRVAIELVQRAAGPIAEPNLTERVARDDRESEPVREWLRRLLR